jgi:hypothetical protein
VGGRRADGGETEGPNPAGILRPTWLLRNETGGDWERADDARSRAPRASPDARAKHSRRLSSSPFFSFPTVLIRMVSPLTYTSTSRGTNPTRHGRKSSSARSPNKKLEQMIALGGIGHATSLGQHATAEECIASWPPTGIHLDTTVEHPRYGTRSSQLWPTFVAEGPLRWLLVRHALQVMRQGATSGIVIQISWGYKSPRNAGL